MPFGPFGRGLKLVHRLMFSMSSWLSNSICPITFSLAPFTLWGLGWKIYPAADATEIMLVPFGLFVAVATTLMWLSRQHWSPLINPAVDLFHAIELAPTAITSFLKPFGKPLVRISPVTAKGDAVASRRVDLWTFGMLVTILALNLGSLIWVFVADIPRIDQLNELLACVAWTFYALWTLTVAALICFERPYRREEERFEVKEMGELRVGSAKLPALVRDVSLDGARLRLDVPGAPELGEMIELSIPSIGIVFCTVVRGKDARSELGVRFVEMTTEMRHRLICTIFTSPAIQTPAEAFYTLPIWLNIIRRFLKAGSQ